MPVQSWGHSQYWSAAQSTRVASTSTMGMLFEEAVGHSANSSNLFAEYEGPHLATGLHRARVTELRGEYEPAAGTFSIELVTDGQSHGAQAINIGSGLAAYGDAIYGTSHYGGSGRQMFYAMQPLSAEGRTMWVKTAYSGMNAFKHFTVSFTIVPETKPRSFSE